MTITSTSQYLASVAQNNHNLVPFYVSNLVHLKKSTDRATTAPFSLMFYLPNTYCIPPACLIMPLSSIISNVEVMVMFFSLVAILSIAGAFLLNAAFQPHATHAASANNPGTNSFKFNLAPSTGITSCLPKA
jgi:hypothetical protein